jgi:hypothetical protein
LALAVEVVEVRSEYGRAEIDPESHYRADLKSRLRDQSHDHWLEFAVIVAGADILLALILGGRILDQPRRMVILLTSAGIEIASITAVILAYYSIHAGAVLIFGRLRAVQLFNSFAIAGSQLALFLWPAHVMGKTGVGDMELLQSLRQWFLFFTIFAFVAIIANRDAASLRKNAGLAKEFPTYEVAQRRDSRFAGIAGILVLVCWAVSLHFVLAGVILGELISVVACLLGISSQARGLSAVQAQLDDTAM